MEDFKFYCATIKSDTGKYKLWLSAQNEYAATMLIQVCQECPKSAILKLVERTKKQFQNRNK